MVSVYIRVEIEGKRTFRKAPRVSLVSLSYTLCSAQSAAAFSTPR